MQIFHSTSVFLTMVVLCSLLSSLSGVLVKYSRETVTKTEGQFVSLKCEVQYDTQNCDIESNWWYINGNKSMTITDPNHYLITVNETGKNQLRSRNLFLSFHSLSLKDSGQYQCDAKCVNSGTEGKGHLLYLDVKADPNKGLQVSTWSGQLKADEALLALSAILFVSRC